MYVQTQIDAIPIVNEIRNYTERFGLHPRDWQVGITDEPLTRLPQGHGIRLGIDPCIYLPTPNEGTARFIEEFLIDPIFVGMSGGGGGKTNGRFVYAYPKQAHTRE